MDRLADDALQMARDAGAEARVCANVTLETRVAGESRLPELAHRVESANLDILVSREDRTGCAAVNGLDSDSVREAVAFALSLARFAPPDPIPCLATPAQAPAADPLEFLYDRALEPMSGGDLRAVLAEAVGDLRGYPGCLLERYECEVAIAWRNVRNTLGVHQTEQRTRGSWSFQGLMRHGDDTSASDYEAGFSFTADGLAQRCRDSAVTLGQRLTGALASRAAPTYRGPVVLGPRAVHALVVEAMAHHASGWAVADGTTGWADALGQLVAARACSLVEQPHDGRYTAATAFDADGVPTRTTPLLEQGLFVGRLHNVRSAARLGESVTGHANRDLCLCLGPGQSCVLEMLAAAAHVLLVHRFAGSADPTSGDYSGVAKSSRLWMHGREAGSVTEAMVAGTLSDFVGQILALSREVTWVNGEFAAPYVLVDGVSVTGK
jgi:PmbA protein